MRLEGDASSCSSPGLIVPPDRIPRRFRSDVSANDERNRSHPLEDERKFPAKVTVDACDSTDDTRGKENPCAPAHANVCRDVRSENGRYDLGSIGRGKCLCGNTHVSDIIALALI